MHSALPIHRDNWRSRWLQLRGGLALHRVSAILWDAEDEMISGTGTAVCGVRGRLSMPGLFSRTAAPRCTACCDALGIPGGDGAPFNALEGDAADA